MDPRIASLLTAWFSPAPETQADIDRLVARWFASGPDGDREIGRRFGPLAESAALGELGHWRETPESRLALILLLDQLPRQLHRGTAAAFAQDVQARALTMTGIESGMDRRLQSFERAFFYMPLQHSESLPDQELGVAKAKALAEETGSPLIRKALEGFAKAARDHRDIIARFGRFPHRNRYLGREDTPEERAYLEGGAPTFGQ
ncbi:MAG TPA: DUF924 family protein [Gammaproteobacteria bacterium]|nr:DUF924 family protein [Gammaproteobacteria bacterium]